jgi:hypothetical protein
MISRWESKPKMEKCDMDMRRGAAKVGALSKPVGVRRTGKKPRPF